MNKKQTLDEYLKAYNEGIEEVANRIYNRIPDAQNYNFTPTNNNMTQKDIFEAYILNHQNPSVLPKDLQTWRDIELGGGVLKPDAIRLYKTELPYEYIKLLQNPNQNWR